MMDTMLLRWIGPPFYENVFSWPHGFIWFDDVRTRQEETVVRQSASWLIQAIGSMQIPGLALAITLSGWLSVFCRGPTQLAPYGATCNPDPMRRRRLSVVVASASSLRTANRLQAISLEDMEPWMGALWKPLVLHRVQAQPSFRALKLTRDLQERLCETSSASSLQVSSQP